MEFYCAGKGCPAKGSQPYAVKLPEEMCVDEHNCAAMFCPHCLSTLVKKEQGK